MAPYLTKDWLHNRMETRVILGRSRAQPFGCAAECRPDSCFGRRWVRAETGGWPGNDSLPGLEKEIRVVWVFWIRLSWRSPPVLPGTALVTCCRKQLTSGGVVVMMWVSGPGRLASVFLLPTRPVSHIILCVTIIQRTGLPVWIAFLHLVMIA